MLCISISFIIVMTFLVVSDDVDILENENNIGIVYDVKKTEKGYSFSFEDVNGIMIRCFSYDEPFHNGLYDIKGEFSTDGKMFFVNRMEYLDRA